MPITPYSAARRVACPGSRALEEKYPQLEQSASAAEGTLAHWVAMQICASKPFLKAFETTPEMISGGELFKTEISKHNTGVLHLENEIKIPLFNEPIIGRPDAWIYNCEAATVYIYEYKFGRTPVEAFENWQLIEYGYGISSTPILIDKFIFKVIQPRDLRGNTVKTWEVSADKIASYFNTLRTQEQLAANDNAPCIPNPECTYCSARHACPALQAACLQAVDISEQNTPIDLTPDAVGSELRILEQAVKRLNARITGLTEQATSMIRQGSRVSHYTLESTVGRETWRIPTTEVIALGKLSGLNLQKPIESITPKQARDAGLSTEFTDRYAERSKGALKLTPLDERKLRGIFE